MECELISEIRSHERTADVEPQNSLPRRPKAAGRSTSLRPSRRDTYDATARLYPRKKTVAFGSTVPYSQTVEGVLDKKQDQQSNPAPEQRYKSILRKASVTRPPIPPVPAPCEAAAPSVRGRQLIAARRAERAKNSESDRFQRLEDIIKEMKNEMVDMKKELADKDERIVHLETVIASLAQTLSTGASGTSVAIPVLDLSTPTGTAGILKYGAPLKQSTPSTLVPIANAKNHDRARNRTSRSRPEHIKPLEFKKTDVRRAFADLNDSLEENRFVRRC